MDAFDADVLIYAASAIHPLGRRVEALLDTGTGSDGESGGVGSVLLLPEVLAKPLRDDHPPEVARLLGLLGRLDLQPVDAATAELATAFRARYGLRTPDAVHLATAVLAGADRFVTNNRKDFPKSIVEVDVVYPDELPDPGGAGET